MRVPVALSLVFVAAAGLSVSRFVAFAEDTPAPASAPVPAAPAAPAVSEERIVALEAQVAALKADVDYLRAREVDMTTSALNMLRSTANLRTGVSQARTLGFEMAAVPANSRQTLLASLDVLARDLSDGLPSPTPQQKDLQRHAADLRRKAWPTGSR